MARLVSVVTLVVILFKIRADNADSQRPARTSVSQEIAGSGDRARDSPNEESWPDKGNQWNKTNVDNTSIRTVISQTSLEQKATQLFIIVLETLAGSQTMTQTGDTTYKALQKYPVAGLIYFPQSLQSPKQLRTMTAGTQELAVRPDQLPLLLSVDEGSDKVAHIANHGGFDLPKVDTMVEIRKSGDTSRAYEADSVIGEYLEEPGIDLDLVLDADVLTNPDNTAVLDRSSGSDPILVAQMTKTYMKGLEERHIYGTSKHFPGHGAAQGDSHKNFTYTYKTWGESEQAELVPFAGLIQDNTPFIMAGHISMPRITGDDTPSSPFSQVLTGHLWETMGYRGIIITDTLNMRAIQDNHPPDQTAVMALQTDVDLLLMSADFREVYGGVLNAIKTGELTEERIDQSLTRILSVKLTLP